jgi:diaminopimelate epimerase
MKTLTFSKYSGNGNDFIIIESLSPAPELVKKMCDRHFGIGADGVLELLPSDKADGRMRIYNADGGEAEMCGNGLRCLVTYMDDKIALKKNSYTIETMNAIYEVSKRNNAFAIEMSEIKDRNRFDLSVFDQFKRNFFINTGVPHLVFLADDVMSIDMKQTAPFYRHHGLFEKGTNVSFVQILSESAQFAYVRTYERGVEDETHSCGTGLTACALALNNWFDWQNVIQLKTKGGLQKVEISDKVYYSGEVTFCFSGEMKL